MKKLSVVFLGLALWLSLSAKAEPSAHSIQKFSLSLLGTVAMGGALGSSDVTRFGLDTSFGFRPIHLLEVFVRNETLFGRIHEGYGVGIRVYPYTINNAEIFLLAVYDFVFRYETGSDNSSFFPTPTYDRGSQYVLGAGTSFSLNESWAVRGALAYSHSKLPDSFTIDATKLSGGLVVRW